jgi:hypothetical protein
MERIKEALNAARAERDRRLSDSDVVNSVARRLRLFSNFENLGEDARRAVVEAGEVLDIDSGEAICTLGERDERVNYLLEGMVRIETADGTTRDLHAGDGPARHALDEPGYKVAGIIATHPSRIFRIDPAQLPGTPLPDSATPAPTSAYADTFSGQQLAMLVGALRNEHRGLNGVASAPGNTVEVALGDRTLGVDLELPDLESTRAPLPMRDEPDIVVASPAPPPQAVMPSASAAPADALLDMTRAFEAEVRRYVDGIRREERARAQAKLKGYAEKLKAQAEEQLRNKVKAVRARFEQANVTREQDIRKRYEQLLELANRLTRQKAEINQARQQIEDKLRRAETLHRELAELGGVVSGHLDQIDEMLPADDSELSQELARGQDPEATAMPVPAAFNH